MSDFAAKVEAENPNPEDAEGEDDGPAPEEESTATFTPVVQLESVEVKTHEEDEDVVYKQRAKLFVYGETMLDKGTGTKSWKERGIGDMRFLKHKESNRIRVLMRQEKTMKVIANHFLDPRITLVPNAGNEKSWVWVAFDFADEELVETTFAIRFGTPEIAQEYKAEFEKAQEEMKQLLAGEDAAEGAAEADAAADAVAALNVKSEAPEAAEAEAEDKKKEGGGEES
mmetsp:Transcript_10884/g.17721  ORF Transcript_10884/g.17721 Transcript_10884/m.17721 type:complete len:227 (+) Transcript_10884:68-748(+)|eukprot:CAMPEP_0174961100 /NCGR_PEP_ID=MMETSP0004_2-20121128/4058_1 /TAXON_ID=420556 /ORGANISM="Ochromonas sp., Strain CCMP1393" /LENGTH=226 /DNA_ID=CAMNT_0016209519 /DNA_START=54 /DNA_END=734 /DNA_ORIENTATION=+